MVLVGLGWGLWICISLEMIVTVSFVTEARAADALVAKGRYVFALAGGCGCHTAEGSPTNAGGRPLKTPFGTFYGTNITPDPTHGIGRWTDRELINGIRLGVRPDGSVMSPVMPYPAFNGMSDEDVTALVAYLRTLPAVARENQSHKLSIPLSSVGNHLWRWLFFSPIVASRQAPKAGIERGHYISEHVAHCQECHTPRTLWGTLDRSRDLAGNPRGIDGEATPNITPDLETGVGKWSEEEMVSLLKSGFLPNMDNVQGLMALVIEGVPEGGYKDMSDADAQAVTQYLKSVPPIVQRIETKKK